METFSNLTGDLFGEPLTSSQADSLASRSVRPESERAEPMNDISFRKCFELFERSNRYGSSLKTFAGCLVSRMERYSPKLSHHWKAKATRSLRFVFLLQPSKPRTGEIDCGLFLDIEIEVEQLLPTPTTQEPESSCEVNDKGRRLVKTGEGSRGLNIARKIAMLPTARTRGLLGGSGSKQMMQDQIDAGVISANDASGLMGIQMLPTPQLDDAKNSGHNQRRRTTLASAVFLPTPATRDYKGANSPEHLGKERGHHDQLPNTIAMIKCDCQSPDTEVRLISQNCPIHNEYPFDYEMIPTPHGFSPDGKSNGPSGNEIGRTVGENTGLRLQPAFVEYLMGYPIGWTVLED